MGETKFSLIHSHNFLIAPPPPPPREVCHGPKVWKPKGGVLRNGVTYLFIYYLCIFFPFWMVFIYLLIFDLFMGYLFSILNGLLVVLLDFVIYSVFLWVFFVFVF